jgi:hypothetical protein
VEAVGNKFLSIFAGTKEQQEDSRSDIIKVCGEKAEENGGGVQGGKEL